MSIYKLLDLLNNNSIEIELLSGKIIEINRFNKKFVNVKDDDIKNFKIVNNKDYLLLNK